MVFSFIACDSDDKPTDFSGKDLIGKWTWIKSTGGIKGSTFDPLTEGKAMVLDFSTSTLNVYENETLVITYNFNIEKQNSIFGGTKNMLVYDAEKVKQSFEIENNVLKLYDECVDCFTSEYSKL
jgi:hypothetical protein